MAGNNRQAKINIVVQTFFNRTGNLKHLLYLVVKERLIKKKVCKKRRWNRYSFPAPISRLNDFVHDMSVGFASHNNDIIQTPIFNHSLERFSSSPGAFDKIPLAAKYLRTFVSTFGHVTYFFIESICRHVRAPPFNLIEYAKTNSPYKSNYRCIYR